MYGYIYLTTNLINGKRYIGQHKSEKFDESYRGSGVLLQKAIRKYGFDNFKIIILKECDSREELNELEIFYIMEYDAANSDEFYNIARGGAGHTCDPWNKGLHGVQDMTIQKEVLLKYSHLPASELQKETVRKIMTGRIVEESTREKLRQANLGRHPSENTRKKMSKSRKGKPIHRGDTWRENVAKGASDRVHIHKGNINKNPKKSELQNYLDDGYEIGYYKKK